MYNLYLPWNGNVNGEDNKMIFIMYLFISSEDFVKRFISLSFLILFTIVLQVGYNYSHFSDKDCLRSLKLINGTHCLENIKIQIILVNGK